MDSNFAVSNSHWLAESAYCTVCRLGDGREGNRIATILVDPMVKHGESGQRIDRYSVLRTLLDFYGLPALGASYDAAPVEGVWKIRLGARWAARPNNPD